MAYYWPGNAPLPSLTPPAAGRAMIKRFEHSQVYHPTREIEFPPTEVGRPFEEVTFLSRDRVKLHGWFFPAAEGSRRGHYAVLFCHGNGGNISSRPGYYRAILESGVNLLTFDYRGYGKSEGKVTELGTYLDAQAGFAWLKQKGFDPQNILAWGESLGGGVASDLATRERIGGVVLQSTFSSVPDLGVEIYPWLPIRWMASIHYDTRSKLPGVLCPVVILHSRGDKTISFAHAERNFAAAGEPKLLLELRGDHTDALTTDRARFVEGIEKFLQLVEARSKMPVVEMPGETPAEASPAPAPEPAPAAAAAPAPASATAPVDDEPFEPRARRPRRSA